MKLPGVVAAMALGAVMFALPAAHAQDTLMKALDFGVLKTVSGELDLTVSDEGVDEDGQYYLEVQSEGGLIFYLYGAGCSDSDPAKECLGLNMIASFTLGEEADPHEVMDSISYAFMKLYATGADKEIKASRYVIFDGGISRENMKENVSVFAQIADRIWGQLIDLDVLAE